MNKELITYQIGIACYELQQQLQEQPLELEEYKNKNIVEIKERLTGLIGDLLVIKDEDEYMINALSEHIKALQDRKSRLEQRVVNIKRTILNAFEMSGALRFIAPNGTVSTANRKVVTITDMDTLFKRHPEYFKFPPPKLNSRALEKDLREGVILEGVELEKKRGLTFKK